MLTAGLELTLILLSISLEFLEWAVKFSFWDGTLGVLYSSLSIFEKLAILWFLAALNLFNKNNICKKIIIFHILITNDNI